MLENGNAVQSRRSTWGFRGASYVLIFVWVISALVPIIFCLLYHQQVRTKQNSELCSAVFLIPVNVTVLC